LRAVGGDFEHPVVVGIGNEHVPGRVHCHALGLVQAAAHRALDPGKLDRLACQRRGGQGQAGQQRN